MSGIIPGLDGREPFETPFEKRRKAEANEKASGSSRAPQSSLDRKLAGESAPVDRIVKDPIDISPEAKRAARAEAEKEAAKHQAGGQTNLPIGELYHKAVIDRVQDRLPPRKDGPEPSLLQRVYSSIRSAPSETETKAPTPDAAE